MGVVLPLKRDVVAIEGEQPVIADRDPMRVAPAATWAAKEDSTPTPDSVLADFPDRRDLAPFDLVRRPVLTASPGTVYEALLP